MLFLLATSSYSAYEFNTKKKHLAQKNIFILIKIIKTKIGHHIFQTLFLSLIELLNYLRIKLIKHNFIFQNDAFLSFSLSLFFSKKEKKTWRILILSIQGKNHSVLIVVFSCISDNLLFFSVWKIILRFVEFVVIKLVY